MNNYNIRTRRVRFGYRATIHVTDEQGIFVKDVEMENEHISIPEAIAYAEQRLTQLKEWDSWGYSEEEELVA